MREWMPDWVIEGKYTEDFLAWLEAGGESICRFSGRVFVKGAIEDCELIYASGRKNKEESARLSLLQLCGIFRKSDLALYEVSPVLYQAIGIPEEFCFPDKKEVQEELEKKVTARGRQRMREDWDGLMRASGRAGRQFIPAIDREQIRMAAKQYLCLGKTAGDIAYLPRFSFDALHSEFSDEAFLRYLNDEAGTVELVTGMWMEKALPDIAKKRVYYGCIREELAEMEKTGSRKKKGTWYTSTQSAEKKSA